MTKTLVLSLVLLGSAWGSLAQAAIPAPGQSADPVTIVQADDDDEDKKKKRGS
jgi:hypothetical protein